MQEESYFSKYGKTFQDFKINVHISGRRGPQGIIDILPRLTPEARNTLTIEPSVFTKSN